MEVNLWFCPSMNQWRWTLTKNDRPIMKQEAGQRPELRDAMQDIATNVKLLMKDE